MKTNRSDIHSNVTSLFFNITSAELEPSPLATYTGAAIMAVFLVTGLVGNLLIMLAIITNRRVWNVINTFIISLAINDLLTYTLIVVFIISSYARHGWSAGDVMCKLNPELTVLFTGCSLWHTALIAIHRYIVVCHNSHYARMSKAAYVAFVLVVARAIPMACVFPGFSLHTSAYQPKMLRCILLPSQGTRIGIVTLLLIFLPCLIVVLCYAFVFGFVWRIARQMHSNNLILKREVQITKMFGVVFFMILLGFLPYAILRNADRDNDINADAYAVVTVVYAIATCSNPLVYGAMSTEIRRACATVIRNFLQCVHAEACCPCAKLEPVNTYTEAATMTEQVPAKPLVHGSQSSVCHKFQFCVSTSTLDNGMVGTCRADAHVPPDNDSASDTTPFPKDLSRGGETTPMARTLDRDVILLDKVSNGKDGDVML